MAHGPSSILELLGVRVTEGLATLYKYYSHKCTKQRKLDWLFYLSKHRALLYRLASQHAEILSCEERVAIVF